MSLGMLVVITILGVVVIVAQKDDTKIKLYGLYTTLLLLLYVVYLVLNLDKTSSLIQFPTQISWFGINLLLGLDGMSAMYVLLTALLFPVCIIISWDSITRLVKKFIICLLLLELLLFGVFCILDVFGFYILFEAVLIPMIYIIGIWGGREQKITAAYYFFFYTLIGSLLMLLSIIYMYVITGTTDYLTLLNIDLDVSVQKWLFLGFFASLAVKIPKFPFHVWLPQAHAEAPVAGSVILAGILIKLGSYGFLRFVIPFFPDACSYFSPLVFTLGVLAVVYASLTTLRQTDLKRIIAYSSVSHMGIVMLGLFSLSQIGIEGSVLLQIAHGFVSSALFIIVTLLYDRYHTRTIKYYRGVAAFMPIFSVMFLFFTMANIAVPLSSNFIGEFLCLLGCFNNSPLVAFLGSTGMILSAAYGLFLLNRVCFGQVSPYLTVKDDITRKELYALVPLVIPTLVLGVYPNVVLDYLKPTIIYLLNV